MVVNADRQVERQRATFMKSWFYNKIHGIFDFRRGSHLQWSINCSNSNSRGISNENEYEYEYKYEYEYAYETEHWLTHIQQQSLIDSNEEDAHDNDADDDAVAHDDVVDAVDDDVVVVNDACLSIYWPELLSGFPCRFLCM